MDLLQLLLKMCKYITGDLVPGTSRPETISESHHEIYSTHAIVCILVCLSHVFFTQIVYQRRYLTCKDADNASACVLQLAYWNCECCLLFICKYLLKYM